MPPFDERGCPHCHSDDTMMVGFTRTGVRSFRCDDCGNRWNVTVEDEVLAYTSQQPKVTDIAADRPSRSRSTPSKPINE
jgi:transposase-like protein